MGQQTVRQPLIYRMAAAPIRNRLELRNSSSKPNNPREIGKLDLAPFARRINKLTTRATVLLLLEGLKRGKGTRPMGVATCKALQKLEKSLTSLGVPGRGARLDLKCKGILSARMVAGKQPYRPVFVNMVVRRIAASFSPTFCACVIDK